MPFLLDIDYTSRDNKSEAWERLFLAVGWGVRDVRGPYMTEPRAVPRFPTGRYQSTYALRCICASPGRCPVDALIFNVSGGFGSVSCIIRRPPDVDVVLDDIRIERGSEQYPINVALHDPEPANVLKFMDILAINRIAIQRGGWGGVGRLFGLCRQGARLAQFRPAFVPTRPGAKLSLGLSDPRISAGKRETIR
jgi:hypothetical protein